MEERAEWDSNFRLGTGPNKDCFGGLGVVFNANKRPLLRLYLDFLLTLSPKQAAGSSGVHMTCDSPPEHSSGGGGGGGGGARCVASSA